MKHILIACGILLAVLSFCLLSMFLVREAAADTLQALTVSAQFAKRHDFSTASAALRRAEDCWQQHEAFLSCVLAHDEVDQVAEALAELRQYAVVRDYDDYLATVSRLTEALRHIRKAELPVYYNLF